jgi:hypothetical protein
MSDDRGTAGHLEQRSVVGIVGLSREGFFRYRLSALARESIGRAVLEAKREIVVSDVAASTRAATSPGVRCLPGPELGVRAPYPSNCSIYFVSY